MLLASERASVECCWEMDGRELGRGRRKEACGTFLLTYFRPPLTLTWVIGVLLPRCSSLNLLKSFSDFSGKCSRKPSP